jgi:transketolase
MSTAETTGGLKTGQDTALDQLCVNTIRVVSIEAVQRANSGHPGLPLGAAPMAYTLWDRYLKHNPTDPAGPDRDRFILSAGHGSMLLYSLLYLTGYDLSLDDLKQFRQWGSRTPGHPEYGHTAGVETTTGPLGQGFATGVGMAMTERFLAARFNRPGHTIVDHYTYAIVSDGDLMEGVASEAASLAGHLQLGKLIYLYDANQICLAGTTNLSFTEDVGRRFDAYGWHTEHVEDGNDLDAIDAAIERARAETNRPSLILVHTTIGYGSPNKQGTSDSHGSPLGAGEVELTKQNLGWEWDAFEIPDASLDHFRKARERGATAQDDWQSRFAAYRAAYPDLAAAWELAVNGELPDGWEDLIPSFAPEKGAVATRKASGQVLNALAAGVSNLFGGSADLNPSTNTVLKGHGDFQPPQSRPSDDDLQGTSGGPWGWEGQNIHFGVREHAMGSILNGASVHGGVRPYGATFMVFSDYMRPAIRLAALMKQPVIYVFTHDSIALGEDGPTHQPVEHLAALRAIPNLLVIRPGDANETAEAWRVALGSKDSPVMLALTRQDIPVLDRAGQNLAPASELAKGAYVLAEARGGEPRLILIGTGSELSLCLQAREQLEAAGVPTRVVSMPCWELFDRQPVEYRQAVLPDQVTARLAVEAGSTQGWCRYTGTHGDVVGVDTFGASAPAKEVLKHYGFTVEHVVARARELLGNNEAND